VAIVEKQFIKAVVECYHNARNPHVKNCKVTRGRSRIVSSYVEELFAEYIASCIDVECIYVDYQFRIDRDAFYPDVAVQRGGKIVAMFDLKMDMGYIRDQLRASCEKCKHTVERVRGKKLETRDGRTKQCRNVQFSEDCSYDVVVVSEKNISESGLQAQKRTVEAGLVKDGCATALFLSGGMHPNEYSTRAGAFLSIDEVMKNITINYGDFKFILSRTWGRE
jgi:hypothetical protein